MFAILFFKKVQIQSLPQGDRQEDQKKQRLAPSSKTRATDNKLKGMGNQQQAQRERQLAASSKKMPDFSSLIPTSC